MLYAARSHIGLVRQLNEDSYEVHPEWKPWQLIVVADGMGGASAGEVASRLAAETLTRVMQEGLTDSTEPPTELLLSAIHAANQTIWDTAKEVDEYTGMGTTLVAAAIHPEQIILAHVGDSRGYIFQGDTLRQVTRDHSLVAELVRRGQLTEEEAFHHPQKNIVTRSLGTTELSQPDIDVVHWQPGDVLLVCTDGLSDLVSPTELANMLRPLVHATSETDVENVADRCIRLALERGGRDNITLVLVVHRDGSVDA